MFIHDDTNFIFGLYLKYVLTGSGRQCYFCDETSNDCNADIFGVKVHCQLENSSGPHYGDVCIVGHTGKI